MPASDENIRDRSLARLLAECFDRAGIYRIEDVSHTEDSRVATKSFRSRTHQYGSRQSFYTWRPADRVSP